MNLRESDAGDGWSCAGTTAPTCTRAGLDAGATTRAYVPVSVSAGASDGTASVILAGAGVARTTATTSRGVLSAGFGAVFAAHGSYSVVTAVSGATLSLGGTVVWAELYWAGSGTAPANPTAYVRAPGAAATRRSPRGGWRRCRRPAMTRRCTRPAPMSLPSRRVARGGWPSPATAFTGGRNTFGGWALLAVVSSGGSSRTVAVYDAARILRSGGDSFSSTVHGDPGGAATLALVAWEGDRGTSGDAVTFGAGALGSPPNNIARSQADGTSIGWNTFGTDARVLSGTLRSATEAALTASATGDTWLLGAFAIAS